MMRQSLTYGHNALRILIVDFTQIHRNQRRRQKEDLSFTGHRRIEKECLFAFKQIRDE